MEVPPDRLAAIVERLQQPIPDPPRPVPKPRATWQGWRVGDRLAGLGGTWEVEATTTEGATIRLVAPFRAVHPRLISDPYELVDFVKLKKPRARKPKEPTK